PAQRTGGEGGGSRRGGGASRLRVPLVVALALAAAGCNRGNRLYREGEYRRAAAEYARALARGDRSPELRYNLGTALLQLEAYDSARAHLEAASAAPEPGVRQPASYNGGNADLLPVFHRVVPEEERRPRLERAVAAYQRALLLDPADLDAKWNLEIALRLLEREEEPSGGGGGGGEEEGGGGAGADPAPTPDPAPAGGSGLSTLEAEQILAGAQRAEAEVQGEKLRKQQPRGRAVRDW
ncbi:MAG TPA: tetratricopeptide repeat protein, partial [Longimicrobiaceae bacterium]|nr:tetratricopeptide repeat protein [Longimicrobiaceae bacterium]